MSVKFLKTWSLEALPWRFLLFAGWLVVAARMAIWLDWGDLAANLSEKPLAGIAYDVYAFLLLGMARIALGYLPWRWARLASTLSLGITAVTLVVANQLTAEFYQVSFSPDMIGQAGDVWIIRDSIRRLLHPGDLIAIAIIPLSLLIWAAISETKILHRFQRSTGICLMAMLAVGIFANYIGNNLRPDRNPCHPLRSNVLVRVTAAITSLVNGGNRIHLSVQTAWLQPAAVDVDFRPEPGSVSLGLKDYPLARRRKLQDRDSHLQQAGIDVRALGAINNRPNIVLIVLESIQASELGAYGAPDAVTDNLDRLAAQGLIVSRFYGASRQSVRGSYAIHCSGLPNPSGTEYLSYLQHFSVRCLPEILAEHGYVTNWFYSANSSFEKEGLFLTNHGMQRIFDAKELDKKFRRANAWGVSDEDLLSFAADELSKTPAPFSATVTTGSSHHPYELPDDLPGIKPKTLGGLYGDYRRAVSYTDYALGRFFEKAKKTEWFNNTIFIITGDHGVPVLPDAQKKQFGEAFAKEILFRLPLIIYGPKFIHPGRVARLGYHPDILPTILDIVNVESDGAFAGESLFLPPAARRLLLSGLGEIHAIEPEISCWNAEGEGKCFSGNNENLYRLQVRQTPAPDLLDWARRASGIGQFLARTNHLFPNLRDRADAIQ